MPPAQHLSEKKHTRSLWEDSEDGLSDVSSFFEMTVIPVVPLPDCSVYRLLIRDATSLMDPSLTQSLMRTWKKKNQMSQVHRP